MTMTVQIIAVAVVGAVFVVRLAVAIHSACHDGRTSTQDSIQDGQPVIALSERPMVPAGAGDPRLPAPVGSSARQGLTP